MTDHFTEYRILYLDFDGVLHDEQVYWDVKRGIYLDTPGRTLFEWAPVLEDLLAQHRDVRIVLSTSWVPMRSFSYAKNRLSQTLDARVIGSTFHRKYMRREDFISLPRGVQIAQDVLRRSPRSWIAIDDDAVEWPNSLWNHLIHTDGSTGIGAPKIQSAVMQWLKDTSGR